ncbi:MAG: GIY-YIG nuclease family protein [Patescibacteria group bacterium]
MWHVYILKCSDGTLYTGSTNNLARRFAAHKAGRGGRYTRSHSPVAIAYTERCKNKSHALTREHAIKQLRRDRKLRLIQRAHKR